MAYHLSLQNCSKNELQEFCEGKIAHSHGLYNIHPRRACWVPLVQMIFRLWIFQKQYVSPQSPQVQTLIKYCHALAGFGLTKKLIRLGSGSGLWKKHCRARAGFGPLSIRAGRAQTFRHVHCSSTRYGILWHISLSLSGSNYWTVFKWPTGTRNYIEVPNRTWVPWHRM